MPSWIHDRATHIQAKNPSMPESQAWAIATQQSHALGKSPKGYGTAEGRREAKAKYPTPKDDKKMANPGHLQSQKIAGVLDFFKAGPAAAIGKAAPSTPSLIAHGVRTQMAKGRNFGGAVVDPFVKARQSAQGAVGASGLKLAGALPWRGALIGAGLGTGGGLLYGHSRELPEGEEKSWKDYAAPAAIGALGGAALGGGAEYGLKSLLRPKPTGPASRGLLASGAPSANPPSPTVVGPEEAVRRGINVKPGRANVIQGNYKVVNPAPKVSQPKGGLAGTVVSKGDGGVETAQDVINRINDILYGSR